MSSSDLDMLLGSASQAIYTTQSQTQSLYNTRAISANKISNQSSKILSGIGTSVAEKTPDFDALAKKYDIKFGMSYSDFDDMVLRFNLSKLPNYDAAPMPFVGHIIMTRPSLYVQVSNNLADTYSVRSSVSEMPNPSKNFNALKNHPKVAAFVNDQQGQMLLRMLSEFSPSYYMPLFTTQASSYSVGDVQLKSVEKGQTYYGHTIKYAHYNEEHKFGGSISIDFRNDRYFSVLKAVYIWMSYIDIVSRGEIVKPSYVSQMNGILDYCGSIYYLVTDMRMSRLLYWEKLTGVYPRNAPFSMFSYSDAPGIEDKLTIEFDYGMRSDPCDPNILFDLNMLSGGSYTEAARYMQYGPGSTKNINYANIQQSRHWSNTVRPDNYTGPFGLGDAFAAKPIIQAVSRPDGTLNYYMYWLKS